MAVRKRGIGWMIPGIATILAGAFVTVGGLVAQQPAGADLEVVQVRPNFYMIAGAGGNVSFQVGEDGVVVVDSGNAASANGVVAAIKKTTNQPIRYIINTSADADHVGGNAVVSQAGETLFPRFGFVGIGITNDFLGGAASILSAENVLTRMSAKGSPFPTAAMPTETFNEPRKSMYLNGEGIVIFHQPAAHSDSDAIVFFRSSDVLVAGDVLDTTRFPVIDVAKGGTVNGEIAALQKLVDLAIPSIPINSRDAGTLIISGHGRICNQIDAADYRDMVTIVRDRVRKLKEEGKTLEQVKAANPAAGYVRRFGSAKGPWTTNDFVEAVYRTLDQKGQ